MTYRAQVGIDPHRTHGAIDSGIYGQFVEHIGRAIYGGMYEPGSKLSDDRFRSDVLEAARGLRPTILRWPGGNFASGYHWRDGIGPREERPKRRDLAWNNVDDNTFGTEEFLEYCRRLGCDPYINLNMGTANEDEALQWLEYCNGAEAGIPEVDLRRAGPHPDPHGVKIWGLGNEVYGWWQHGHTSADNYGAQAREWSKLLRWTDNSVKLIAVGAPEPDWNWTVLRAAARQIDYLSLHFYWHADPNDAYDTTLVGPLNAERDIVAAWGMCLAASKAAQRLRPVTLCIDEWGVWSKTALPLGNFNQTQLMQQGLSARSGIDTRFEEPYDLKDALAIASWLHVMWRHPEKVTMATQAQMVNVLAPIHVTPEMTFNHTVYYPLALARAYGGDVALDVWTSETPDVGKGMAALDAGGTIDPASGRIHLSLVNRSRTDECELEIQGAGGDARVVRLWDEDPMAGNTVAAPDKVVPMQDRTDAGKLVLAPNSHTTVVFE